MIVTDFFLWWKKKKNLTKKAPDRENKENENLSLEVVLLNIV